LERKEKRIVGKNLIAGPGDDESRAHENRGDDEHKFML
jgi:hypothetical protein